VDVRKWFKVEVISNVQEPVRDVAFSPNLGRSYHMLAVASKDVHIFSLKPLTRYALLSSYHAHRYTNNREINSFGWYNNTK